MTSSGPYRNKAYVRGQLHLNRVTSKTVLERITDPSTPPAEMRVLVDRAFRRMHPPAWRVYKTKDIWGARFSQVTSDLLSSPSLPPYALQRILRELRPALLSGNGNGFYEGPGSLYRRAITHPNVTARILRENHAWLEREALPSSSMRAADGYERTVGLLLSHENIPVNLLIRYSGSPNAYLRAEASLHEKCPEHAKALAYLMDDATDAEQRRLLALRSA